MDTSSNGILMMILVNDKDYCFKLLVYVSEIILIKLSKMPPRLFLVIAISWYFLLRMVEKLGKINTELLMFVFTNIDQFNLDSTYFSSFPSFKN